MLPYLIIVGLIAYIFRDKIKAKILNSIKETFKSKEKKNENGTENIINSLTPEKKEVLITVVKIFAIILLIIVSIYALVVSEPTNHIFFLGVGIPLLYVSYLLIFEGVRESFRRVDMGKKADLAEEGEIMGYVFGGIVLIAGIIFTIQAFAP